MLFQTHTIIKSHAENVKLSTAHMNMQHSLLAVMMQQRPLLVKSIALPMDCASSYTDISDQLIYV